MLEVRSKIGDDHWRELHSPLLPRHMGCVQVSYIPVGFSVEPGIQTMVTNKGKHLCGYVSGHKMAGSHAIVRVENHSPIKGGDWFRQAQSVDNHLQSFRGPATGDGK